MKLTLLHFLFLCLGFCAQAQFKAIGFNADEIKKQFKGELTEKKSASGQIYFLAQDKDGRFSYRIFLSKESAICNRMIVVPSTKDELDKLIKVAEENYTSISATQWQTSYNKKPTSVKIDVIGDQSVLIWELLATN